ncbi:MAG: F0F1 ATP synthase subunit B [Bacteroidia bacterium]|nr:F0F1 ATP synthase subunit B [Bacteroidia bacterium]
MELVTPGIGLLFWMLLSFSIVVFILGKFAWKPILNALKEREESIRNELGSAENAREEMKKLQADNEKILLEARIERDKLLKEAREAKEQIIAEAKVRATEEAGKLIGIARQNIENEKASAITEIKNIAANLSLDIAEKILRKELAGDEEQKKYVESLLKEINLN